MLLILVLAFAVVLFTGIFEPKRGAPAQQPFSDVPIGATELRRYHGQRVWVTHLTDSLAFSRLDGFVDTAGSCDRSQEFCVLLASTARQGVEFVFSHIAPAQLPADVPWMGGFINPSTGAVFDLLGRPYRLTMSRTINEADLPQPVFVD